MTKPLVIGAGTCIVEMILAGIRSMPGADELLNFHMSQILPEGRETISPELLQECTILIEEGNPWEAVVSEPERALLSPGATTIRIPTLHFNSLWPLVGNDARNVPTRDAPWGCIPLAFGDRLAMKILAEVPDPGARFAAYFAADVSEVVNIARHHELEIYHGFARERGCDVKVAAYVFTHFREKRLFHTHMHPTGELIFFVMAQILAHDAFQDILDYPVDQMWELARQWSEASKTFSGESAPIHPAVAEYYQLKWYDPNEKYQWLGRDYTFEKWIEFYLNYKPD